LRDHLAPPVVSERAAELRDLAARKAAAYRANRAGGTADVITIGGRGEREAMTGDYLTVFPTDPSIPRGARFTARLSLERDRLLAVSVDQ
jgi:hypothetical protein